MNIIFFDHYSRQSLLPLTFTRPVSELRIGILTIREKWEKYLKAECSNWTEEYLSKLFPMRLTADNLFINASVIPDNEFVSAVQNLSIGEQLIQSGLLLAMRGGDERLNYNAIPGVLPTSKQTEYPHKAIVLKHPWDIFSINSTAIEADYKMLTNGRKSAAISDSNHVFGRENIFLEEGAKVECSTLNALDGKIYIGKDAEVMEGCLIRGGLSLGEHSQLKMGTRIYGATSIGPHCKIGGEVNNSIIMGYSNKAHDGFLGNSVIGEWCNLGADTNNSNLKNNYSEVKVWSYPEDDYVNTGLQFCGLIMGDHSKCSINTMFNTGTVVGVSSNIFGTGFPPKFIPSFAWGGSEGFSTYRLNEAMEVAERVYERRGKKLSDDEMEMFRYLFDQTTNHRAW
ncbi:MAG: glucose-1-phosphate thymidylyltransferase [Bacteroidetes bacterium]|nr:MAG: glucose-1-phosphate thymidylyltransferase [Bacteroidota bacterium]REK08108.1 MAG: glucose-1-phosphate thymidylyltransferase [Bacteroidota bacterium]REK32313.1 MAG: glucose-1-phosphate thymidylyltransferase [Bacteroidota bacterium]REK49547.1 MAG: glucose-1-phosphate thymidylyltransferase [Bacteroidota bacterium]